MSDRPRVLIAPRLTSHAPSLAMPEPLAPEEAIADCFVDAVIAAGGVPLLMALTDDEDVLGSYLDLADGIAIPGGQDVSPRLWGDGSPYDENLLCPPRDAFEVRLVRLALELDKPQILITDPDDIGSYGLSSADSAVFYLDFSEQIPSLTSSSPVNLSSRDLIQRIRDRDPGEKEDMLRWHQRGEDAFLSLSAALKAAESGSGSPDTILEAAESAQAEIISRGDNPPRNFYSQYYKAELTKKFVLSAACFCLTLITLPLSMFRVKHGKLTGFAISLLIAVAYWYMLFGVQLGIFSISTSPYWLIALPDLVILLIAALLIMRFRKAR